MTRLCARRAESSVDAGRCFDALVSLSAARVRRWMPRKPASAFVQGLEVRWVVDEPHFAGFSLGGLAHVLERCFAPYVPVTSFVQIVLFSAQTGAPLRRGQPCPGVQPLPRFFRFSGRERKRLLGAFRAVGNCPTLTGLRAGQPAHGT
ncbi:type VI secretion system baseplate subunit TssF [Burkholderia sp. LMG 21824]|uniref:type VI secretion system baseplate subunit TssF n=1 Tax=Burkholderia sp. LMG 21824 TaxID=3158172 RepID=UPI003C30393A